MTSRQRHLRVTALVMLSVFTAAVSVGALRSCWGTGHRHAGGAEPECAMHHAAPAQVNGHGHHDHGAHHSATPENQLLTCNCANDASAPLVMPHAIVVERTPHLVLAVGDFLQPHASPRAPDSDTAPLSPPPRPTFS